VPRFSKTTTSANPDEAVQNQARRRAAGERLGGAPTDHHSIASSDLNKAIELQASMHAFCGRPRERAPYLHRTAISASTSGSPPEYLRGVRSGKHARRGPAVHVRKKGAPTNCTTSDLRSFETQTEICLRLRVRFDFSGIPTRAFGAGKDCSTCRPNRPAPG